MLRCLGSVLLFLLVTPSLYAQKAGSIAETAAAIELKRVAAENPDLLDSDIVKSQTAVLDKARDARAASRQNNCADNGGVDNC